jgi:glycosyltransferase A (GT-A) superfamily protein (DUF2064 family)
VVLSKEPRPGHAKTRLCPPCKPHQAARLAEAALVDTLTAAAATPAARRILSLSGDPGPWLDGGGWEVVPQPRGGLDVRLAHALEAAGGPALLVGMDTPQVTPELLARSAAPLLDGADAVLGPASDGGFWALGLRKPRGDAVRGVPMGRVDTGARQRRRLEELGLRVAALPSLRDVDDFDDALAVATAAPRSRFAGELVRVGRELVAQAG